MVGVGRQPTWFLFLLPPPPSSILISMLCFACVCFEKFQIEVVLVLVVNCSEMAYRMNKLEKNNMVALSLQLLLFQANPIFVLSDMQSKGLWNWSGKKNSLSFHSCAASSHLYHLTWVARTLLHLLMLLFNSVQ